MIREVSPRERKLPLIAMPAFASANSGTIAGIGFTVSLLVATLAFHGAQLDEAKLGILGAALCASVLTWLLFRAAELLPRRLRIRGSIQQFTWFGQWGICGLLRCDCYALGFRAAGDLLAGGASQPVRIGEIVYGHNEWSITLDQEVMQLNRSDVLALQASADRTFLNFSLDV